MNERTNERLEGCSFLAFLARLTLVIPSRQLALLRSLGFPTADMKVTHSPPFSVGFRRNRSGPQKCYLYFPVRTERAYGCGYEEHEICEMEKKKDKKTQLLESNKVRLAND